MDMYIQAVGLAAGGMPDWPSARAILRGEADYQPDPLPLYRATLLPANEARRAGAGVRVAFQAAEQIAERAPKDNVVCVFAASSGDLDISDRICTALSQPGRAVSPTHFHNSVHNAAAGYWSIATGLKSASTSISGGKDSFTLGLLDAACWLSAGAKSVLLVSYEAAGTGLIAATRSPRQVPIAVALLFGTTRGSDSRRLSRPAFCNDAPTRMTDPALEKLRRDSPVARCLPLLQALACRKSSQIVLESSQGNLAVECTPDCYH